MSGTNWPAGSQREVNAAMIVRLRAAPAAAYEDGRPVVRVIEVPGRRSGRPRPFPVNVTRVGGALYACSSTRDRDWVRNLVAAGRCRVERDGPDGADTERRPVLVEGDEAVRALTTYLDASGYHDEQTPFAPGAPPAEIARHVHRTAVVRLDPVS